MADGMGRWKGEPPVGEVAEVVEQLRVVLGHEIVPGEDGILRFRPHVQQVEAEDIGAYARLLSVVTEHPHAATLRELAVFVVQVLFVQNGKIS